MLRCNDGHCRQVMGYYHDTLGCALCNTPLDKVQTFLVLGVKVGRGKAATIVQNLPKVVHTAMHKILVLGANVRPKGREDEINIVNPHNLVLVVMHIRQYLTTPTVAIDQHIAITIKLVVAGHQLNQPSGYPF